MANSHAKDLKHAYRDILANNSKIVRKLEAEALKVDRLLGPSKSGSTTASKESRESTETETTDATRDMWRRMSKRIDRLIERGKEYASEERNSAKFSGIFIWHWLTFEFLRLIQRYLDRGELREDLLAMGFVLNAALHFALKVCPKPSRSASKKPFLPGAVFSEGVTIDQLEDAVNEAYKEMGEDLRYFVMGEHAFFWLSESIRKGYKHFTWAILRKRHGMWSAPKGSQGALAVVKCMYWNPDIFFIRDLWQITESKWYIRFVDKDLPWFTPQPSVYKNLYIPRQNKWTLRVQGSAVKISYRKTSEARLGRGSQSSETVRCRLIMHKPDPEKNKARVVILHIHGGGYVAQQPESQVDITRLPHFDHFGSLLHHNPDMNLFAIDISQKLGTILGGSPDCERRLLPLTRSQISRGSPGVCRCLPVASEPYSSSRAKVRILVDQRIRI